MLKSILNRPVAVLTVFIVLVAVSLLMVTDIPLDMYPDMEVPVLAVTVAYPGAGPEEVEEEVTRQIEGEVSGLEGMDTITSTSSESRSVVLLNFDYGSDITAAENEVRSRLDRVKPNLPSEAEDPVLQKFDPSSLPILSLSFNGDRSERDLMRIAEDQVIPSLEAMEGVASVSLVGVRESIVRVDIDQTSLESYGLSLSTVADILSAQNFQLGAGSFEESDKDILIRTSGRFANLEEIGETVVITIPGAFGESGTPVRLRDMGTVSWGYADADNLVRINGQPGISLDVRKGSDANSVDVADAVKAGVDRINRSLPDGVELALLTDSTGNVRNNLSQVGSAAVLGVLFAVLVLLVFLRQIKSTLIAGLSIPIALSITVAGLALGGRTLNLVTLMGLAMGVGLIVDSSIVIIENIYRYRSKGAPMGVSARRGAGEMLSSITASTLTTIAVFLPLLLYKNDLGFIGIFFGELAFVIIIALLASLAVAAVLVPVLSSRFLTIQTREEKPIRSKVLRRIDKAFESFFTAMENGFARFLRGAMQRKGLVILTAVAAFAGVLVLLPRINVSMIPVPPQTSVYLDVDFPTGTALSETERVMAILHDAALEDVPGVDRIVMTAEKAEGSLEITFREEVDASESVDAAKGILRGYMASFPGIAFAFESTEAGGGMLSSSGVDISVTGSDWDAVLQTADEIEILLKELEGITEVSSDAERGLPQAEIVFDRRALYEQGLNAAAVAAEVRALTAGTTATEFLDEGESYDVVVRLAESDRSTLSDLDRLFVTNASGSRVSLAQIAEIQRTSGPVSISREDQTRTVHVVGALADGASVRGVTEAAAVFLDEGVSPRAGVEWSVGGELSDFTETGSTMVMVMLMAGLMVMAVMVAQFESFKDPLIIILALPMMVIGLILLLLVTGTTLSMISMMGIVMLLGIVVNNGIVLVDYTRLMRRRGMGVEEACIESGRSRLRPVLMTTLTTILAMTPMAFFPGEGGEMMQPMGVAVVGGLTTSTIGTLVLVPTLYAVLHRREKEDYLTRRQRKRPENRRIDEAEAMENEEAEV